MFGFTNTLLEVLYKENPTHIAVVTDTAAPTVRHIEFEAYKAHRDETPEDIVKSFPYIEKIIEGFNIPHIGIDGYEADDVIGTLAKQAEKQGYEVYMMTPDKDYGQLVSENIFIYKPGRKGGEVEILGAKEICAKYGIERPEQVIDILGLMGDSVDNIPGIHGVGEKTALQLVHDFGSVENLLANTDKLKGKLKEKVETGRENAILSKRLATIITDVPTEFHEESFRRSEPNKDKLREVFTELEFRTLAQRVLSEDIVIPQKKAPPVNTQPDLFSVLDEKPAEEDVKLFKTSSDVSHQYLTVLPSEVDSFILKLLNEKEICFDTETTGTDPISDNIIGISFSFNPNEGYYIPLNESEEKTLEILKKFEALFSKEDILIIGQNIKFDYAFLLKYGIRIKCRIFDTMLAHYVLEPDTRHGLNDLSEKFLGYTPIPIEQLIGKGKNQLNMKDIDIDKITEYAAEDADVTFQLYKKFEPKVKEHSVENVFYNIEMPLVPVLQSMENAGTRIDTAALKELSQSLLEDLQKTELSIFEDAGKTFNINSPRQLGDILFDDLKLDDKAKRTKTGQYQTGEEVIIKLQHKHPIINKILDYREFQKLKSTYVDSLPLLIHPKTGLIHTSYNQAVAATGRLSSNNPNLQNIPIRTVRGQQIRKAFVPRSEDFLLLSADYSQIELRIIASLAKEEAMIEAFKNKEDIHTATAARVWGVNSADVTKEMRSKAKTVNFGIIYGISAFGLSERINIPRTEAKELIEQYFIKYPGIKNYMNLAIESARKKGYAETICGRKRELKDINSSNGLNRGFAERNAINAPIQGSAADMIKLAMIAIHKEMDKRQLKSKMILQVHDELVFDCQKTEQEELKELVRIGMINALPLEVPLEVETGIGINWLEAH